MTTKFVAAEKGGMGANPKKKNFVGNEIGPNVGSSWGLGFSSSHRPDIEQCPRIDRQLHLERRYGATYFWD